ncbi:sensor histidine kinase [Psychrobacter sp. I-STPA6b]|uniref:sensor histidine kinase n=1 Tax=Psychrobacter sp. I-STPA6b TaxID=2585718 RepID=UPI001D0C7FEE|nr:HAMP domain-containing sensor histidine kinase [Psychrobacter sp. I-STPA6b]
MHRIGLRSVFSKLFASVMLTLILFAIAMVMLTHLVHDNSANTRWQVLSDQILTQVDPFLEDLNTAANQGNRLKARFMLAVIKKSFDIFDDSLQAKMGLYDSSGNLLVQTDESDLPKQLPPEPSLLVKMIPPLSGTPVDNQVRTYSKHGFILLYESRNPPQRSQLSAALNLFTGTLLLLAIMTLFLWWIARSMTWRINQMSRQMGQLGDGDFSVRVPVKGNDEIATLAQGFNQAAQKIEQLISANNLLLAHASHELRTPITRIRLQVEMMAMLAQQLPESALEKFDKRAQAINRDLTGLNDLVESILLVSRLDAGHALQQVEKLDLFELVKQECQHYPEATLIGEPVIMSGQPKLLIHLIRNLLNNAVIHGIPPMEVQVYGVTSLTDAKIVPPHIIESVEYLPLTDSDPQTIDNSTTIQETKDKPATNNNKSEDFSENNVFTTEDGIMLDIHQIAERALQQITEEVSQQHTEKKASNNPKISTDLEATNSTDINSTEKSDKPARSTLLPDNPFAKRLKKTKNITDIPAQYAVIAVIDQGTGIPEEKRQDIFSPFVRLQQQKKGSGLGLSLVSQIVEAHQGKILTDTLHGHTRFLVILPTTVPTTQTQHKSQQS